MFERIRKYFTLPVFDDDERTRRTRLLISILVPLAVMAVLAVIVMIVLSGFPQRLADANIIIVAVAIVAAVLIAFPLVRRRPPTGLSIGLLTLLWLVTTAWLRFTEGLSGGHTSSGYVLIIVLAGLLLGPRGAIVYAALSLMAIISTGYAENRGLIPGRTGVSTADALIISGVVALTGVFLRYAVKSMQDAIDHARRSAQALAEANSELEAIRRSLEERVAARTQDLRSRSALLLTAIELGRTAASLHDLDELLARMPAMIAAQTGLYHVGIFLADEYGEFVVLRGTNSPEGRQLMAVNYHAAVNEPGFLGTVVAKHEPRLALDVGPGAVSFINSPFPHTRSQLTLPLMAGDRLVGALDLHSTESDAFTDQMIEIMRLLADQIAIAIEGAQLFAQSQTALEAERRAYGQVSREAWREMSRAEGALRFLSDAPGIVRPASGERAAVMERARQAGQLITEEESTLAAPIQVREGVNIGALRLRKPEWSADEIALVETLTEQLGAALESARLYQETQRREARERITREITEDIRRSVEIETILRSAVTHLGEALGVPRTYVRLMLEETDLPSAAFMGLDVAPAPSPAAEPPAEDDDAAAGGQGEEHHES
ncbi:MAG TPA: GAF domain-containing protein [Anaerolineae bacterium]|mgnify:CR=1 FL=1|nr:GAF domain-containing protein [Anaerolineae bacterium]HQH37064.1 GAF domain-containing protein [Anaerolineae bacterium]